MSTITRLDGPMAWLDIKHIYISECFQGSQNWRSLAKPLLLHREAAFEMFENTSSFCVVTGPKSPWNWSAVENVNVLHSFSNCVPQDVYWIMDAHEAGPKPILKGSLMAH